MYEELYRFLDPFIENECTDLQAEFGLTGSCAESAAGLLRGRLISLAKPLSDRIYQDELRRISPSVIPGISFAGEAEKQEACEAASKRLSGSDYIFSAYPRMDHYRQVITDNYRAFLRTFFQRLSQHQNGIRETLPGCGDPSCLLGFSASGADCHLHGSSTVRVETAGGAFYYKPRDTRPDELFRVLSDTFFAGKIRAASVLRNDEGFGFIEEIRQAGLAKESEIIAYYRHFGILLALFRALGSSDMHCENIISSGIFPVCIDLETILTPVFHPFSGTDYHSIAQLDSLSRDLMFSCSNTMVLPMMLQGKHQMSPLLKNGAGCLPVLNGRERTVRGYEEALTEGFLEGYETILRNRDSIRGVLNKYSDMSIRFVLRASSYYAITLREMHSAPFLTDPSKKDREFARLKDRFDDLPPEECSALSSWEIEELEEGDLPYFSLRADGCSLYGDPHGAPLVSKFSEFSAMEHAMLCLSHMGPAELKFERDYLRIRLLQAPEMHQSDMPPASGGTSQGAADSIFRDAAGGTSGEAAAGTAPSRRDHFPDSSSRILAPEEALSKAEDLFRRILDLSVTTSGGDLVFLGIGKDMVPDYLPGFAKGMQGMAVFFSALKRHSRTCGEEAERMLEYCRRDTQRVLAISSHSDGKRYDGSRSGFLKKSGRLRSGIRAISYSSRTIS